MPNNLGLNGAQPSKQTKYAPIYTPRWLSGLWTNRSPFRDATTNRITEKFYGPAGDALISGLNVEISEKLTLIRRPGNTIFGTDTWNAVDRFYDFRLFNASTEQITLMVDEADGLYSLFAPQNPAKTRVWQKSAGAGQTYMQSVGNTLFFGNGVDNKKWLQTLFKWQPNQQLNTSTGLYPYLTTFLIDPNGNIQQLTAMVLPIQSVYVNADTVEVFTGINFSNQITVGQTITFPSTGMVNSFLQGQTITVTQVGSTEFEFNFIAPNQSATAENPGVYATVTPGDGSPQTGTAQPTWNVTVPAASNDFAGGVTIDGTVQWTNRGNPLENWGIQMPTTAVTPTVVGGSTVWKTSTYYSLVSVILDPNGNLQQVTRAGLSGTTPPVWATSLGSTTLDGLATPGASQGVIWTLIASAGGLQWQASTYYPAGSFLINQVSAGSISPGTITVTAVAATSGGQAIYTVTGGGTTNEWEGYEFTITGFTNAVNNGKFVCVQSSSTQLILNNAKSVAETHAATATSTNTQQLCLFQSGAPNLPYLSGGVNAYLWVAPHSGGVGTWDGIDAYNTGNPTSPPSGLPFPTNAGSAYAQASGLTSVDYSISGTGTGGSFNWVSRDSTGAQTGTTDPFPGVDVSDNYIVITGTLQIPVAGDYTITIHHGDGLVWGVGGTATLVAAGSTPPNNLAVAGTLTALNGYTILQAGTNLNVTANSGNQWIDVYVLSCPQGVVPFEINMARWDKPNAGLSMLINGNAIPFGVPSGGGATSGTTQPTWPAFTTADAPAYASVRDPSTGNLQWNNIGPISDFVWAPAENFTLPDTTIVDSNNNIEAPFRTGYTASSGGAPTWATTLDALTTDHPNLIWINLGPTTTPPVGSISTFNGGWRYAVSLVNTLDDTVSNATNLSVATGDFENATGIQIAPGAGLPPLAEIDPQSDFVAIWRTTDGGGTAFLVPSTTAATTSNVYVNPGSVNDYSAPITQKLSDYLQYGYLDTTPDTGLNNLISAPVDGENTPPAAGAVNLTYYLNRIWYSIGATVYWTSGPNTTAGNGLNGTNPLNYDEQAALTNRLVPTTSGMFVFTVSDINLIQGNGTASNPISPSVPLIEGVGLLSYNALDVNGSLIGFFSTDHQFIILDPSSGISSAGYPLGDQFRLNNGQVGQSWDPAKVYVAWYVNGEDQAWYVADGVQGWFRLMSTPAPEQGSFTWAPFAQLVPGAGAVQSIEVTPGNHYLLSGPTGVGNILYRNLNDNSDGGVPYPANAVMGSCVLAQPGQYAVVPFITTQSVGVGVPLVVSVLIDEALPYYTGPWEVLKKWVNDPPNLKPSVSTPAQRFYLSDDMLPAAMLAMQIRISWPAANAPNELLTTTIFGGFVQEL